MNVSGLRLQNEPAPVRVDHDVPFAAPHLFHGIAAPTSAAFFRPHAPTIDDRCARKCFAPDPFSVCQNEQVINPLWRKIEALAPSFDLHPKAVFGNDGSTIERAIEIFAEQPHGGLIVLPTPINFAQHHLIISLASRHRLPAVYPFTLFARSGGLLSYGFRSVDLFRQAGTYIHRILNGEKPGDLPVQAPSKFELAINLPTAKALGLEVPPTLIARADVVIE